MGNLPEQLAFEPSILSLHHARSRTHDLDAFAAKIRQTIGVKDAAILGIGIHINASHLRRQVVHYGQGKHKKRIGFIADNQVYLVQLPREHFRTRRVLDEKAIFEQVRMFTSSITPEDRTKLKDAVVVVPSANGVYALAGCFATGALPEESIADFTPAIVRVINDKVEGFRKTRTPNATVIGIRQHLSGEPVIAVPDVSYHRRIS